ncbi:hypothetical protein VNO77_28796 [Canavalia gladiata]|uniref:Uncharacterized protein n=1 Tax=Canavalia gladiata TaxID=3824 RepID=A0AAN9QBD3_CANGL
MHVLEVLFDINGHLNYCLKIFLDLLLLIYSNYLIIFIYNNEGIWVLYPLPVSWKSIKDFALPIVRLHLI